MNQQWIVICFLLTCACLSHQRSTTTSTTYIAAVVEYPPRFSTNASETLRINSDKYVEHIQTANIKNADIIVFPEAGLTTINFPKREEMQDWTTVIPAPSLDYTPCTDSTIEVSEALKKISCAARNNKIYVVINIAEKLYCNEYVCPKDNVFYYNSNVVFDRTGKIIARYRKTNLFDEQQFNVTSKPELVTFDTDFGVKFGTFICFDILFYEPALKLTRSHWRVTDIVFSTAWFSEAPFLTAVQTQAGWSFSENVNLLASGYNRPVAGSTGSGIYLGREGIGKAIMSNTINEEVLVFEVTKKKNKFNKDDNLNLYYEKQKIDEQKKKDTHEGLWKKQFSNTLTNDTIFLLHDNMNNFQTISLQGNVTTTLCKNNFCCYFKIEMATMDPSTKYRLVVSNGTRLYGTVEAGASVCGLIQCLNDSVSSCGSVQESRTIFDYIEISAPFYNDENLLIMPSTLRSDLLPLSENWIYNKHFHDDHVHISMFLNNGTNNLVTFGIYSRYFDKSGANNAVSDAIYYFIVLLVNLYILI